MNHMIEALAQAAGTVMSTEPDVAVLRQAFNAQAATIPVPDDVFVEAVDAGGVSAEWITVGTKSADMEVGDTIVFCQGGAFVLGTAAGRRELCGRIARATGARVLNLDYRLAPEHPHPAAVQDVVTAWQWLLAADGFDPAKAAIVGESAGGHLVATATLALRDRGLPLPAAVALLSPVTDLAFTGESLTQRAGQEVLLAPELLRWAARLLLGDADPEDPRVSPLYADLTGYPPLFIMVGTREILWDDAIRFADRAGAAGVDVTLDVGEELPHAWPVLAGTPEAHDATDRLAAFLTAHTR
jgi:acetyl esterase/lipase